MKTDFCFPITDETFPQCWEYVDRQRRTARKKSRINKTAGFFSSLVFMLLVVFLVNGLIYTYRTSLFDGLYCDFLE